MSENVDLRASADSPLPASHGEGSGRILLAAPRGYCAGVDRAVDVVEKALELYGAPVYVRKEIVHNKFVVESLTKRGAIFVQETDEVPEGARVVFSAHGVSPAVHEAAATRHLATIDATCPLVTKVHREAVRFAQADHDIIPTRLTTLSCVTLRASCGFPRPRSPSTRPARPWTACASASRSSSTRRRTTSATPPRTARVP